MQSTLVSIPWVILVNSVELTSYCLGLFTPNAGQHFRDEQRRRRSQYDRGTRLAALEEYEFEPHMTSMQPQGLYSPQ